MHAAELVSTINSFASCICVYCLCLGFCKAALPSSAWYEMSLSVKLSSLVRADAFVPVACAQSQVSSILVCSTPDTL